QAEVSGKVVGCTRQLVPIQPLISKIRIRYIMEYIYLQLDQIFRPQFLMQIAGMVTPAQYGSRRQRDRWNEPRRALAGDQPAGRPSAMMASIESARKRQ